MTDQDDQNVVRIPDVLLHYDAELVYTYNGQRFTGIGYEDDPERGRSEISCVDGAQEGPSRDWYPSGQLKGETIYKGNVRDGHNREFREDGSMWLEEIYEHGVLVRSARFDENGNVIESFEISEDSPSFSQLQRLWEQFGR